MPIDLTKHTDFADVEKELDHIYNSRNENLDKDWKKDRENELYTWIADHNAEHCVNCAALTFKYEMDKNLEEKYFDGCDDCLDNDMEKTARSYLMQVIINKHKED